MDELIKTVSEPLIAQGVLGTTTLLFAILTLLLMKWRGDDRKAYDDALEKLHDKFNAIQEARVDETRLLTEVVTTFSSTSQIVLSMARKESR